MSAPQILTLLARKHSGDVFVSECKTGPTQGYGVSVRKLDAWAMKRSWAHPAAYGYEIKVNRSDFLRDEKWREYLPHCNYFSFACPWGLIAPAEVEPGIGLYWVTKTGGRLHTKRKPARRDGAVDELPELFQYVLQSRCKITRPNENSGEEQGRDYWERWLHDREKDRDVGYRVARRCAQLITEADRAAERATAKAESLERVERRLDALGIEDKFGDLAYALESQVQRAAELFPDHFEHRLRALGDDVRAMMAQIELMKRKALEPAP